MITIKDLPKDHSGFVLLYNPGWEISPWQVGRVHKGKLLTVGHYFAHDVLSPTHYRLLTEEDKPTLKELVL